MATTICRITVNGRTISAQRGELLLDAALMNGVDLPHECRAGHCGTCRVRLVSGCVRGGDGSDPGVVHACQCRILQDAAFETFTISTTRSVTGEIASLRPLSEDVTEVGLRTDRALPHHPGQYARLEFDGFPSRPYSISLPLSADADSRLIWFHIRRLSGGRVSSAIGERIRVGHGVTVGGPYGSAYFRPGSPSRMVLIATNTGFAPIWAIAAAALRENPVRMMMVIIGGRHLSALYMTPALARMARFPNVQVVPVCSGVETAPKGVLAGRPTDYLPQLLPGDVVYACGAPEMVETVKSIAARQRAVCHADPFIPSGEAKMPPGANTRLTTKVLDPGGWSASSA